MKSSPSKETIFTILVPLGFVLLNFIIKYWNIGVSEIALDEPFTIFYAQQNLEDLFQLFRKENNPPLHFLIEHFWIKGFGINATAVRFPSLLFSTFTVWILYKISYKFFNLPTAIIAATLFTFSNFHLVFAHEARVYSFLVFLSVLSMYAFLSLLQQPSSKKYTVILLLTNICLIYSHFFGFWILLLQGLTSLSIRTIREKLLKKYILLSILSFLAYLPFLSIFFTRFSARMSESVNENWLTVPTLEGVYNILWAFSNLPVPTVIFLIVLLSSSIKYFFFEKSSPISINLIMIILWLVFPFVAIFILSQFQPLFTAKYLAILSPAYYLLIGVSTVYLSQKKSLLKWTLPLGIVGLMVFTFQIDEQHEQEFSHLVEKVRTEKTATTAVYVYPAWFFPNFTYHYDLPLFQDYKNAKDELSQQEIHFVMDLAGLPIPKTSVDKVLFLNSTVSFLKERENIMRQFSKSFPKISIIEEKQGNQLILYERE